MDAQGLDWIGAGSCYWFLFTGCNDIYYFYKGIYHICFKDELYTCALIVYAKVYKVLLFAWVP